MKKLVFLLALCCLAALPAAAQTRLLRSPDVSDTQIVFSYAGDLWIVGRDGGDARRLTANVGRETSARFSPDGSMVAFSAQYDGNTDVYRGAGGRRRAAAADLASRRRPGARLDAGRRARWSSPRSAIGAPVPYPKFWTVPLAGGLPTAMPMPRAWTGQLSPDGGSIAYEPILSWEAEWRNYRGGQNRPIWVLDLEDLSLETLPWEDSNDGQPVWLGDTIYFLSDRDWAVNVWAYDIGTGDAGSGNCGSSPASRSSTSRAWRVAAAGWSSSRRGYIHRLDTATGETRQVPIEVRGDFAWARPHWEEVGEDLARAGAVAERQAGDLRGPRRDLHRAGREGRRPQPDRRAPAPPTGRRPGRRTASGSPGSRTRAASTGW